MQRTPLDDIACSIARTVDVIGEWWTPLILRDLFAGLSRFEDIRRDLGIASNVLTARLERLVAAGIVERRQYQSSPARWEYVLTEKGNDLFPVIVALVRWGDRWSPGEDGPPVLFVHDACGATTVGAMVCHDCGAELTRANVRLAPGPGGRKARGTAMIGEAIRSENPRALPSAGDDSLRGAHRTAEHVHR